MIADAVALYDLIRRIYGEHKIIGALFDWKGNRLQGDERLKVQFQAVGKGGDLWFYRVEPVEDYQFIRIPVNAGGVIESLGTVQGEKNADAEFFRYIPVHEEQKYSITPNAKANFMVIAYRPADLLTAGKGKI